LVGQKFLLSHKLIHQRQNGLELLMLLKVAHYLVMGLKIWNL